MRRLRELFPTELVVLGIHSAKFPAERVSENLRRAVYRHGIEHPVANDADLGVWQAFSVRAWPTLVLVDPEGRVIASEAGEIDAEKVAAELRGWIADYAARGLLDRRPVELTGVRGEEASLLRFPAKLCFAEPDRLFVADAGHHRVLELRLAADARSARVERCFGSGRPGMADGPAAEASFHHPHGLAVWADELYVADTDNHAVRAIDLETGAVRTAAGTGAKARHLSAGGIEAKEVALRSPWALLPLDEQVLLIAMAGSHQIWALLPAGQVGPFAGSGREALVDGPRTRASFNQPSDLALGWGHVLVADAEASAIRAISFDDEPRVFTLVGQGLFEFGDRDGRGAQVRLQHPTGLAFTAGQAYIADSYNHKIKVLSPASGEVRTLIGNGRPGQVDGGFAEARLYEPEGLAFGAGRLWIADTNNHAVRVADLGTQRLATLKLVWE